MWVRRRSGAPLGAVGNSLGRKPQEDALSPREVTCQLGDHSQCRPSGARSVIRARSWGSRPRLMSAAAPPLRAGMRRRSTSRGFTLLEILLVLSLLVVIGATVMPFVGGTLGNHRLRKSADLIRAEWLKARAKAMQTGRTYVFRYEPEADSYVVQPWYSDEDLLESSELGLGGGLNTFATPTPTFALSDTLDASKARHLPEDIVFVASETTDKARELIATQSTEALQNTDTTLSEPIFFYADGTSSTARLLVMNQRSRYILLTLRGLTGVVYVSEPMNEEQAR